MNVADFLIAGKQSDRVAIRTLKDEFTYGELAAASLELACGLTCAGACKGDRVLLISANSFHWIAAYLGILRAGLVCVPLPSTISTDDLAYIVESTEARYAFVEKRIETKHERTFEELGVVAFTESQTREGPFFEGSLALESLGAERLTEAQSGDLASLMFTSGSTAKPRGVMISHANIMANTTSIIASLKLREDDRMMVVLPFHYCFGASLLHTYLRAGGTLVIENRFTFPEIVLNRMEETECTSFAGVPSHYQILLRNSTFLRRPLRSLRSMLQAGGHLAPDFVSQLQQGFPNVRIFIMYGQTEATARLSCLSPEKLASKRGSIGVGIPGVTLRIVKMSGEEVSPGEVGELVAEGANIAQGYWRDPEETKKCFRDGRLYTGDLATVDDDGFIFLVDRAKDFIKCGGVRIGCCQIEDLLLRYEDLLEVAVISMPDEILGEAVRAFIVPKRRDDLEIEERFRSFCRATLPLNLIPRKIIVLNSLPKNSSGKVIRPELRSMAITCRPRETAVVGK